MPVLDGNLRVREGGLLKFILRQDKCDILQHWHVVLVLCEWIVQFWIIPANQDGNGTYQML